MNHVSLSDLERFGFKPRNDGSLIYRDKEKNVRLYPTKCNRWGISLQLRRWVGGVQNMRLKASNESGVGRAGRDCSVQRWKRR